MESAYNFINKLIYDPAKQAASEEKPEEDSKKTEHAEKKEADGKPKEAEEESSTEVPKKADLDG